MTPEEFIHSIGSFKPGYTDFCELASSSSGNDNVIFNIGFWFKVIKTDGIIFSLSVQFDSFLKNRTKRTIVIAGENQLRGFLEKARQWAEDELNFLITGIPVGEENEAGLVLRS
jgi:hypothetical protein